MKGGEGGRRERRGERERETIWRGARAGHMIGRVAKWLLDRRGIIRVRASLKSSGKS